MGDIVYENCVYDNGSLIVSGNAIILGGPAATGVQSIVFSNTNGAVHLIFDTPGNGNQTVHMPANGNATLITSQSVQTQNIIQGVSAGTQIGISGNIIFSNSNGISFGMSNNSIVTASYTVPSIAGLISNIRISAGTTSNNLSAITFSNSNGLAFGLNGSVITGSYTVPTQTNQTIGLYAASNTTQNSSTTLDARSLTIQGAGIASIGYSNGSMIISVPSGAPSPVNFSAGTTSGNLGSIVFSNANGISFGLNGSTITASVNGAPANRSYHEVIPGERLVSAAALSATQFSNRPILMPFHLEGTGLNLNTIRFLISGVGSSNRSFGGTFSAGVYYATNSTQLSLIASDSMSFSITASSQSTLWNGLNIMDFTRMSTAALNSEGRYVLAFAVAPVSANATWMSAQLYGGDNIPQISRFLVGNTTSATNNTSNVVPFWGVYSTTTNNMPSTIADTQVNGGNSASLVDVYAVIKEI